MKGYVRSLVVLNFAYSILLVNAANADTTACEIQPVADSAVGERALTVKTPDGRQLTVVGYQHGNRQFWRKLNAVLEAAPHLTGQEFSRKVRQLVVDVNANPLSEDGVITGANKTSHFSARN